MTITRIFQKTSLIPQEIILLDERNVHYVSRVLRANVGDELILFNGEGGEYNATIVQIDKKDVILKINQWIDREAESSLKLYLAQGISRSEKMDFTIQKAVELGVQKIFPVVTERCNVKLDEARCAKRLQRWESIIISACEQSGRNTIPELYPIQTLDTFLASDAADCKLVLAPIASKKIAELTIKNNSTVTLLVGPEGGLSSAEIMKAVQCHYLSLNLGPRILRTETAGLAAITALQCYAGDMIN